MTISTYATAREMQAALAEGSVSARELLEAHIARNEALHKSLNAVIDSDIARAFRRADAIDAARTKGAPLGPLAGIPMTVKHGYDVEHMPANSGNPAYANRAKDCADAELAARARAAGAVIWGKTNVPFMLGDFQSYNSIHGTTNNPYDVTRTPGGSSGGAAAALAAGITPLEIGSDIGGSLRHPANFCGVCSLKPTWGVLPMRGHVPPPPGIDVELDLGVGGPMARNVGDLELLWRVLSRTVAAPRREVKGARVALWDEEPGWPLAKAVKDKAIAAAKACEQAGMIVERTKPGVDMGEMLDTYLDLLTPLIAAGFPPKLRDMMEASREADLKAVREGRDEMGAARYRLRATARESEILAAQRKRAMQKAVLAEFFESHDAILMPISPVPAFRHDHSDPINARMLSIDGTTVPYMSMLNWIGLATSLHAPAIVIPAGLTAEGLPVGVQLVGAARGEDRLFEIAAAAEETLGGTPPPPL
jgi:amidase